MGAFSNTFAGVGLSGNNRPVLKVGGQLRYNATNAVVNYCHGGKKARHKPQLPFFPKKRRHKPQLPIFPTPPYCRSMVTPPALPLPPPLCLPRGTSSKLGGSLEGRGDSEAKKLTSSEVMPSWRQISHGAASVDVQIVVLGCCRSPSKKLNSLPLAMKNDKNPKS